MKSSNVELAEKARKQGRAIAAWWRANRPAAPRLFENELEDGLRLLGEMPNVGVWFENARIPVRRLLLSKTQYHLYFRREGERTIVLAIWPAQRGHGPRL